MVTVYCAKIIPESETRQKCVPILHHNTCNAVCSGQGLPYSQCNNSFVKIYNKVVVHVKNVYPVLLKKKTKKGSFFLV